MTLMSTDKQATVMNSESVIILDPLSEV
ncbi:uncharacterized protein METZ01_LOCUS405475 [marine metagenome]|uniref:Uncharacterized protein n=1 Tax=marine metagenome TaxID=408172 RepID=A0A382W3B2_9ZZZZ